MPSWPRINQTQLSPTAFLQDRLVQFGFSPFNMKSRKSSATLNQIPVDSTRPPDARFF